MGSWLRNSMRMSKVLTPGGSTKTLMTHLKVITLVSDIMRTVPQKKKSRSGAHPLSLHHSPQEVNPPAKTKIKKEKRKVKDLNTRTRTQVSPPPSQKHCHGCSFPPRSKELRVNAARVPSFPSLTVIIICLGYSEHYSFLVYKDIKCCIILFIVKFSWPTKSLFLGPGNIVPHTVGTH